MEALVTPGQFDEDPEQQRLKLRLYFFNAICDWQICILPVNQSEYVIQSTRRGRAFVLAGEVKPAF